MQNVLHISNAIANALMTMFCPSLDRRQTNGTVAVCLSSVCPSRMYCS